MCLNVRKKIPILSYFVAMSRNIPNPQLSGTDFISKASDKPKGHMHYTVFEYTNTPIQKGNYLVNYSRQVLLTGKGLEKLYAQQRGNRMRK